MILGSEILRAFSGGVFWPLLEVLEGPEGILGVLGGPEEVFGGFGGSETTKRCHPESPTHFL